MDSDSPTTRFACYRRYLEERLCWIDGSPTHVSSDTQRQCSKCRVKWSYTQASLEFAIFERFCNGDRARKTAEALGCSRNTVMGHYRSFTNSMEDLVAEMLIEERIATTPQSLDEVILLEKALRAGSERRRARACLYLFLNSLSPEERLQELFPTTLGSRLIMRINVAKLTETFKVSRKEVRYCRVLDDDDSASDLTHELSSFEPQRRGDGTTVTAPTFEGPIVERIGELIPEPKRTRLIESIGQEITAFIEKYYASALPSRACRKLGGMWVNVWKSCRKTIARSGRP